MVESCRIHPEGAIKINLKNHLYCVICHDQVNDYDVFKTDGDREI